MADISTDPADTTPKTITGPEDARDNKNAGVDGNHYTRKTRSGHEFTLDDSKGGEHITLQHRGGSMIQFRPDGCVQFVSHNGQYNFVFGENRIVITGAYDIVVRGDASLKVDGDYNVTVDGNVNLSAGKNFNVTAKNFNQLIRGDIDIQGQNRTEKMGGNISQTAKGAQLIASEFGMTVTSTGDALALAGKKQVGIVASEGELMTRSKGKTSILSDDAIAMEAELDFGLYSKDFNVEASGHAYLDTEGNIEIEAGEKIKLRAIDNLNIKSELPVKSDPLPDVWLPAPVSPDIPSPVSTDDVLGVLKQEKPPKTVVEAGSISSGNIG